MSGRRLPQLPWFSRGLVAGAAGTAAMASWYHLIRFVRRGRYSGAETLTDGTPVEGLWSQIGLDYDDTMVPGQIVASLLQWDQPTPTETRAIALGLRWTYGSAFGLAHVLLRNRIREPYATLLFGGTLMTVASVAFPLLGGTPPPWRWPADVQANSVLSHTAYVVTASVTANLLR